MPVGTAVSQVVGLFKARHPEPMSCTNTFDLDPCGSIVDRLRLSSHAGFSLIWSIQYYNVLINRDKTRNQADYHLLQGSFEIGGVLVFS
jgi:hypothetical protein